MMLTCAVAGPPPKLSLDKKHLETGVVSAFFGSSIEGYLTDPATIFSFSTLKPLLMATTTWDRIEVDGEAEEVAPLVRRIGTGAVVTVRAEHFCISDEDVRHPTMDDYLTWRPMECDKPTSDVIAIV